MYRSILLGTDGSDTARAAAEHAIELASRLEVPLHVVAVVETRTEYDSAIVDPAVVEEQLREAADAVLAAVETRGTDAGVSVETARLSGVPHEQLLEYADERGISILVVGSRGRSSFRRALLGSNADALVRLSAAPVLVVGSPEDASGFARDRSR